MSSVLRGFAQTPSRTFTVGDNTAYGYTFAQIQQYFASNNPEYVGNVILFNSEQNLGNAIFNLEDAEIGTSASTYSSVSDMGKKLYIGVKGGRSDIFVFTLGKINSDNSNAGLVRYFNTAINYMSGELQTALNGRGDIDIFRGGA
jgi:hypothetical protein